MSLRLDSISPQEQVGFSQSQQHVDVDIIDIPGGSRRPPHQKRRRMFVL